MFQWKPTTIVAITVLVQFLYCDNIGELSCPLTKDFCKWTTQTEASHPDMMDIGWVIYSPELDGDNDLFSQGEVFTFAHSLDDMRTFLISPKTQLKGGPFTFIVKFSYYVDPGSTLTLFSVNDDKYVAKWSSSQILKDSPVQMNGNSSENNSTTDKLWVHDETKFVETNYELSSFQIAFVGYIKPNNQVALVNVYTTYISAYEQLDSSDTMSNIIPNPEDTPTSMAWKFFIIFSLIVCFGAIFMAAILIVGKPKKNVFIPINLEASKQEFRNPSFRYAQLEEDN